MRITRAKFLKSGPRIYRVREDAEQRVMELTELEKNTTEIAGLIRCQILSRNKLDALVQIEESGWMAPEEKIKYLLKNGQTVEDLKEVLQ